MHKASGISPFHGLTRRYFSCLIRGYGSGVLWYQLRTPSTSKQNFYLGLTRQLSRGKRKPSCSSEPRQLSQQSRGVLLSKSRSNSPIKTVSPPPVPLTLSWCLPTNVFTGSRRHFPVCANSSQVQVSSEITERPPHFTPLCQVLTSPSSSKRPFGLCDQSAHLHFNCFSSGPMAV
ncbi:hypothetical protein AOLI_G00074500 [Acnodon oligacanthus]